MTLKILAAITLLFAAQSARAESIEEFLRAFHANPAREMERLPSEVDENGVAQPQGYINREKLEELMKLRNSLASGQPGSLDDAGPDPGEGNADTPEVVVEPGVLVRNINEMHERKLTQVTLDPIPWADSYWPIAKGLTAARYGDPSYPDSKTWLENQSYVQNYPASWAVASGDPGQISRLSPAEKYDFLMGDANFTLTNFAWKKGAYYWNNFGAVPSWMGICHGWAGAAHMAAKYPVEPITVRAVNGTPVTLYNHDIKALLSMLWAYGAPKARFAGRRCNTSNPFRDPNGRILAPECFDVSPSTWHLAAVNQAGIHKRSFVLDATYDYEVWNFPLVSFKYRYFNPQTWQESASPAPSIVSKENFTVDKFASYRHPDTRGIIGIFMDVTFVKEVKASHRRTDVKPPTKTLRFVYDLELNGAGEVLGGEWYANSHPDFLWTFGKDDQARAKEDNSLDGEDWQPPRAVPAYFTDYARRASARGEPLFSFLSKLVEENSGGEEPPRP